MMLKLWENPMLSVDDRLSAACGEIERLHADEPMGEIAAELVALAVKAGRRASYDLLHACDLIKDAEQAKFFRDRANHWLDIFSIDNGVKDYRHRLHCQIWELETKVKNLTRALNDAGIEADPDGIPF